MILSKLKRIYIERKHNLCISKTSELIFLFKEYGECPNKSKVSNVATTSLFFRKTIQKLAFNESRRLDRYISIYQKIFSLIKKYEKNTRVSSDDIFNIIKDIDGYPDDLKAVYFQLKIVFDNILGEKVSHQYFQSILFMIGDTNILKEIK